MHRGDPIGVPLCTYEHPKGVLIPDPVGVRLRYVFFFRIARSAFGFPAPLPPPKGVVYATLPDPVGVRLRYVFFFRIARSAFGFPAPLPPPKGVVYATLPDPVGVRYTNPKGWYTLRLMRAHACECTCTCAYTCAYNFGLFDCKLSHFVRVHFGQNCATFSFL